MKGVSCQEDMVEDDGWVVVHVGVTMVVRRTDFFGQVAHTGYIISAPESNGFRSREM